MTEPDRAFQADVARVALAVAGRYGFALAGGLALIAHGVVDRPTEDVDLFTDDAGGVRAAADRVLAALRRAGLEVEPVAESVADLFDGFDSDLAEFEVRRDDQTVRLQLAYFGRSRHPVAMEVGPVLHLDDVLGTKVAALAARASPRDIIDVAAAIERYSRQQLLDLGRRADPALSAEEFAAAMRRLDRLDDAVFGLYQVSPAQVAQIRARFADWPRTVPASGPAVLDTHAPSDAHGRRPRPTRQDPSPRRHHRGR
jgi:hypothetical protein